ncbi:MAG: VOC family protein [Candidatus Polarisedimenticolia bacterium]
MAQKGKGIPEGYQTVTPSLFVRDAARAIEFYRKAFGAEEIMRMPGPDGKGIMHAEIRIGDSAVMLADENPAWEAKSPESYGGTPVTLYLYVADVDAAFKRAVDAGAKVKMPVTDMFWGDRFGKIVDPFGHQWGLATRVETVAPDELARRARTFAEQMKTQGA